MKKIKVVVQMIALVTLLTGCSNTLNEVSGNVQADTKPLQNVITSEDKDLSENEKENPMENTTENVDSKVLIAYFSRIGNIDSEYEIDAISSASVVTQGDDLLGNMEYMASLMQDVTGGDIHFIKTSKQYPSEYDLSGKKIYLFNSSGGGGARDAYSEVSDLEPGAQVEKNIFSVSHSQVSQLTDQDMQEWLSEIGYDN